MDTEATAQAQGANVGPKVIRANQFFLRMRTRSSAPGWQDSSRAR
jgi:hypothetical protein